MFIQAAQLGAGGYENRKICTMVKQLSDHQLKASSVLVNSSLDITENEKDLLVVYQARDFAEHVPVEVVVEQ